MLGDLGLYQKFVAYEAAIRVPLLMAGPGIPAGKSDALVELMDLNPTLVELAGLPHQPNLDAKSFYPVLMGSEKEHRKNCINFEDRIYYSYYAIRDKKYKYIITVNDRDELYNLEEDPDETKNIVDEKPEVARKLYNDIYERVTEGGWHR
jgi:choline-sulfatase